MVGGHNSKTNQNSIGKECREGLTKLQPMGGGAQGEDTT